MIIIIITVEIILLLYHRFHFWIHYHSCLLMFEEIVFLCTKRIDQKSRRINEDKEKNRRTIQ